MFHILVVDDDKNTRMYFEAVLKNNGYTVTVAKNGEEALESKKKTGNRFAALYRSKSLPLEERQRLIIEKQQIEIERLKKGYIVKGVGAGKEYVTLRDANTK